MGVAKELKIPTPHKKKEKLKHYLYVGGKGERVLRIIDNFPIYPLFFLDNGGKGNKVTPILCNFFFFLLVCRTAVAFLTGFSGKKNCLSSPETSPLCKFKQGTWKNFEFFYSYVYLYWDMENFQISVPSFQNEFRCSSLKYPSPVGKIFPCWGTEYKTTVIGLHLLHE